MYITNNFITRIRPETLSVYKSKQQKYDGTTNVNLNNLNCANKTIVSFKSSGYYKTLNENYFNLPTDKQTGKPFLPDIYKKHQQKTYTKVMTL